MRNVHPYFPLLILIILSLSGCALPQQQVSQEFEHNWDYETVRSDVALIKTAPEAIARRVDLVRSATKSIDIEYFSWDKDTTGLMLLNELIIAAERGVKVRIILDDLLVFNDKWLASAASHHNLSIKLFNPFNARKSGWLSRAFDFKKNQSSLDHRLHEKYINIDGQTLVLGGRNIGDAYFSYKKKNNFFDLDVLVRGDVISSFEANFEEHWNGPYTSDLTHLITVKENQPGDTFRYLLTKNHKKNPDIVNDIEHQIASLNKPEYVPAKVTAIFDSAKKIEDAKPYFRYRVEHFIYRYPSEKKDLFISTPYMLPNEDGFKVVNDFITSGAKVTLATNSLASNDSGFVPAYYATHRHELLDKGLDIYEYDTHALHLKNTNTRQGHYHNKAFILDHRLSYIGSSNFDPRSDFLNLELGLLIESEEFAIQLKDYIIGDRSLFWKVNKNNNGKLEWQRGEQKKTKDPNYSIINKASDKLFKAMDIESEL
ncbi:phospholipase D family protein [Vibrio methylphosphonaticus]|uniref:phospholipase D family protein n=1 Tax=Vibrio methylphosphonaticus TaxID=2946866 RepID=UPI002029F8D4|nr:phospholipase D family protein [Vibrio methylphosphonaticus]MCL9773925.1 phospholipase D family protein [Vibrio methylphosphonaticus]